MFTGLVEDVGTIEQVRVTPAGRELRVRCRYDDLTNGESIALNGACLTVREHGPRWFTVAAVTTTIERTTIGEWTNGQRVNLERAMEAGDRFGGHLVLGHVDGVATVVDIETQGDAQLVNLALPDGLSELMIPHGSLTVDGVSLTVNELPAADVVQLSLIEFTLSHTTLSDLRVGQHVHVEGDVIGKYVRRMLSPYQGGYQAPSALHAQD
ncbi:MAG: Lumazine-binding domain protein [Gemmatimonadetes bacterium]|nr:Lumazine-binding domain protein [Gemmatimonadota bacterium]